MPVLVIKKAREIKFLLDVIRVSCALYTISLNPFGRSIIIF